MNSIILLIVKNCITYVQKYKFSYEFSTNPFGLRGFYISIFDY